MTKTKQSKKISTAKPQSLSNKEVTNLFEEKAISAVLDNYSTKFIDLSQLNDDEKMQMESNAAEAVKALADSLDAQGLLQNMLATQIFGIHELQQKVLPYAYRSMNYPEQSQYYINAVAKLSNVFIQQINQLQKLQGNSQQKVVVEHLHIHEGGQAIVGQVTPHRGDNHEK